MFIRSSLFSLVLCGSLFVAGCGSKPPATVLPTMAATVAKVTTEEISVPLTLVGRCMPHQSVDILARVTGTLVERPFSEGSLVKKGDVLFQIDVAEFAATLETAQARDAQAEAKLAQAKMDLGRIEPLAEAGAAPRQELDNARTALLAAEADVRYAKATVVNAELQLSYTTIMAPFAGRVGRATRDVGSTIGPADGALVTLDQVDPIAVEFAIAERDFLALRADVAAGRIVTPGPEHLLVKVQLLDGSTLDGVGRIDFRDVRIRPETGSAQARASFPNANGQLVPGQFARVHLEGLKRPAAILLPQRAVLQTPTGSAVYVVDAQGNAEARTVLADDWAGDRWLIMEGLKPGETVVVDGLQGVIVGKPVNIGSTAVIAPQPPASAQASAQASAPATATEAVAPALPAEPTPAGE